MLALFYEPGIRGLRHGRFTAAAHRAETVRGARYGLNTDQASKQEPWNGKESIPSRKVTVNSSGEDLPLSFCHREGDALAGCVGRSTDESITLDVALEVPAREARRALRSPALIVAVMRLVRDGMAVLAEIAD